MNRCVIIGGASIGDCHRVRQKFRSGDFFVCCDSGLRHCEGLGISPDLIVGDFDSHEKPNSNVETIVLPCEKDDTDTVFAVKEMLVRGYEEFLLVGVVGERLDHTLGNVSILFLLDSLGKKAEIIDDFSVMEAVSEEPKYIGGEFLYFSLINITGKAQGITIKNAKYPLENAIISCDYQYGVSNEPLPGKTAEVSVGDGRLLLIKVY